MLVFGESLNVETFLGTALGPLSLYNPFSVGYRYCSRCKPSRNSWSCRGGRHVNKSLQCRVLTVVHFQKYEHINISKQKSINSIFHQWMSLVVVPIQLQDNTRHLFTNFMAKQNDSISGEIYFKLHMVS